MKDGGMEDPHTLYSSLLEDGPIINQSTVHFWESSKSKFLKLLRTKESTSYKEDMYLEQSLTEKEQTLTADFLPQAVLT